MGSPLGPALANIFVGYYEEKLFSEISKPAVYFRYVDDTFAIFRNEKDSEEFLTRLNDLHSSLRFTFEKEKNNSLPFLDVHVERTKTNYKTSVYGKSTFNGQRPTFQQSDITLTSKLSLTYITVLYIHV